jgi:hypothetical protein
VLMVTCPQGSRLNALFLGPAAWTESEYRTSTLESGSDRPFRGAAPFGLRLSAGDFFSTVRSVLIRVSHEPAMAVDLAGH